MPPQLFRWLGPTLGLPFALNPGLEAECPLELMPDCPFPLLITPSKCTAAPFPSSFVSPAKATIGWTAGAYWYLMPTSTTHPAPSRSMKSARRGRWRPGCIPTLTPKAHSPSCHAMTRWRSPSSTWTGMGRGELGWVRTQGAAWATGAGLQARRWCAALHLLPFPRARVLPLLLPHSIPSCLPCPGLCPSMPMGAYGCASTCTVKQPGLKREVTRLAAPGQTVVNVVQPLACRYLDTRELLALSGRLHKDKDEEQAMVGQ